MGLKIKNNYLLLEEADTKVSEFAAFNESNKYIVAFADSEYQTGDVLYLRSGAGEKYKVGGNEYILASLEDVVAQDAA